MKRRKLFDFSFAAYLVTAVLIPVTLWTSAMAQTVPVYRNIHAPVEARVADIFNRLTEKEKLSMLTGTGYTTQPIPRLGLPGIVFADAGLGVRGGGPTTSGPATAFPSGAIMASSWDPTLLARVGKAIGEEARNKGTGVQMELGPGVNINRTPTSGRDSEYYGEDPYLAAHLDVPFIESLQSTGVGACVKHFACNNEEIDRMTVNVVVGQRAMREIYLPAFEAAVTQAHVDAIMPAYNKVNGKYCTANTYLMKNVLRKDWGFDGLAISDWGAVHGTSDAVNGGNDIEMPGGGYETLKNLQIELANGHITQSAIDGAVRNIVRCMVRCGLADPVQPKPNHSVVGSFAHQSLAYEAALEGITLLKNDGNILPLDPYRKLTIAVIGTRAQNWQIDTGGSPQVQPTVEVNALQGIMHRVGGLHTSAVKYQAADDFVNRPVPSDVLLSPSGGHGLLGTYYSNMTMTGKAIATRTDRQIQFNWDGTNRPTGIGPFKFSVRWTGRLFAQFSGKYQIVLSADDGCRLWINNQLLVNNWKDGGAFPITANISLKGGKSYPIRLEYYQDGGGSSVNLNWLPPAGKYPFDQAAEAAKNADLAIVFVGSEPEGENFDRVDMNLDDHQALLVKTVAKANRHTIVILNNGGPVLMNYWIKDVPAVVDAGFPGEYGGKALASILFGDTCPSGKLVDTYGVRRQDYSDYGHYPGVKGSVVYTDGIYVGYRHFDKKNIAPEYPFGYGLSYTTFSYSNETLSNPQWDGNGSVTVSADITNTGKVRGSEVAELYVEPKSPQIDRPIRELKGFNRVDLAAGETKTVTFTLEPRDFAYCDVAGKQWRADAGDYDIEIGGSSRDLPLHSSQSLTDAWTQPIPGMLP